MLAGLAQGQDVLELQGAPADLPPWDNTFPGEVLLRLARDALDVAGVTQVEPIPYEGMKERYLPECRFGGRDNHKFQFAVLATGAGPGGIEPDLLGEVSWWQADDFWWFALAGAVAIIRGCAGRAGESVEAFARRLAEVQSVRL